VLERIILAITIALSVSFLAQSQTRVVYVAPGLGIDGITVGYSTKNSVTSKYGDDYSLIEHNKYSYEMKYYDQGMSFWYRYGDPEQKIFSISVRGSSRGFTGRGIFVGRSTLQDVVDAYGKVDGFSPFAQETWSVEYSGVVFHVAYKESDNTRWTREQLLKRKIVEIEVIAIEAETPDPQ